MHFHFHAWSSNDPKMRKALRAANEARAYAFYQNFKRVSAPFAGAWRRLLGALARRWEERATIRELQALSDDMLKDIGISRGEIRHIARSHAETQSGRATPIWQVEDPGGEAAAAVQPVQDAAALVHTLRVPPRWNPRPPKRRATPGQNAA